MKRAGLIVCFLTLCLLLCSCTSVLCKGTEYRLLKQDGKYYIQFHTDYSHEKYNAALPNDGSRPPFYPVYPSAAALREALLSGEMPYYYLAGLNAKAATAPLEILDPEMLYDVRLPEGLAVESVRWEGNRYVFDISSSAMEKEVTVTVLSQGEYTRLLMENYQNGGCGIGCTALSFQRNEYRDSMKLRYCTGTGYNTRYYAAFLYEFETPQGVRYICETHELASDGGDVFPKSDGLSDPGSEPVVHIFWSDGSGYFWVKASLRDMSVTDLWLNSFRLTPITK